MVRVNQLPMGLEDLAEIVPESPDLVLLPKIELPEQVAETDRMIGELKGRLRHHPPHLADADSRICTRRLRMPPPSRKPAKNVVALTIGLEDYTADLGVAKTAEGRESLYARSRLVNASKATGVRPLIPCLATWATWRACGAGRKIPARSDLKVWAAFIPDRFR